MASYGPVPLCRREWSRVLQSGWAVSSFRVCGQRCQVVAPSRSISSRAGPGSKEGWRINVAPWESVPSMTFTQPAEKKNG